MNNIELLARECIVSLTPYSSARDEYAEKQGVFLDANENPYGVLNRYPDPYQNELKTKLAELKEVDQNRIFIGNGSDEVIDLIFRVFCNPGEDKAIIFTPTYGMYKVSAEINNVGLIQEKLNDNFQVDASVIEKYKSDKKVKLLFICSPNNPTGSTIDKGILKELLLNFNGIVVVDEAYIDFCPSKSVLSKIDEYNNLVICQTFSKAWGLAAARVGVAYANQKIIGLLNKVKPPYNVSSLNQKAAIDALNNREVSLNNIKRIISEREKLANELNAISLVRKVYPSEANFLLIEVSDADNIYAYLVEKKVIVRNRNNQIKNCIRISVGTKEENETLLNTLKELEK